MIFERAKQISTWLLGFSCMGLAACIVPGAERIVGPDGSPMLHVHCGADQSQCFRLAGESCPYGYEYAPVYAPEDGNFFVRCRSQVAASPATPAVALGPGAAQAQAPAPAPVYAAPSPAPRPAQSTASSGGDWPPGEVGRATEPWNKEPTTVVGSAAPAGPLPPTPRTKFGEVDVGY